MIADSGSWVELPKNDQSKKLVDGPIRSVINDSKKSSRLCGACLKMFSTKHEMSHRVANPPSFLEVIEYSVC